MKRYLRIISHMVFQKDHITKKDLLDVMDGSIDALIDTKEGKYYDPDQNKWEAIQ